MRNKRIFTGILFIVAGFGLVANRLGYFPDISIFNILATVYLISFIIRSVGQKNVYGILIPLSLIGVIYWDYIGISTFNPWTLVWAAVLISTGISIIFGPKNRFRVYKNFHYKNNNFSEGDTLYENVDGNISIETTFSSCIRYLKGEDLERVNLECTFGGMKIYFDNVKPLDNNLKVNIDATFSGLELYIPKEWKVTNEMETTFGAVKENNKNTGEEIYNVILIGESTFSGVNIIYI